MPCRGPAPPLARAARTSSPVPERGLHQRLVAHRARGVPAPPRGPGGGLHAAPPSPLLGLQAAARGCLLTWPSCCTDALGCLAPSPSCKQSSAWTQAHPEGRVSARPALQGSVHPEALGLGRRAIFVGTQTPPKKPLKASATPSAKWRQCRDAQSSREGEAGPPETEQGARCVRGRHVRPPPPRGGERPRRRALRWSSRPREDLGHGAEVRRWPWTGRPPPVRPRAGQLALGPEAPAGRQAVTTLPTAPLLLCGHPVRVRVWPCPRARGYRPRGAPPAPAQPRAPPNR